MITLTQLNRMNRSDFVAVCGPFFEHSPWIAEQAWHGRPFESLARLHNVMQEIVANSTFEKQLELIRAHPDLVGRFAREGLLTQQSTTEQAAAGLTNLSSAEAAEFDRYTTTYRERFGFPFVICARHNRKDAILSAFPLRLQNSTEAEIATALDEIYKIAGLRLADAISEE